jgi:hypothetical protein
MAIVMLMSGTVLLMALVAFVGSPLFAGLRSTQSAFFGLA